MSLLPKTAATIASGNYTVTVTDVAGNPGKGIQSVTVNAVAPTASYANGPEALTNDASRQVSGTTNAVAGSPIGELADDQTLSATV